MNAEAYFQWCFGRLENFDGYRQADPPCAPQHVLRSTYAAPLLIKLKYKIHCSHL